MIHSVKPQLLLSSTEFTTRARLHWQGNSEGLAERFCANLADMEFDGKISWQMATLSELDEVTQDNLENGLWVNEGIHLGFFHACAKEVVSNQYAAYSMV